MLSIIACVPLCYRISFGFGKQRRRDWAKKPDLLEYFDEACQLVKREQSLKIQNNNILHWFALFIVRSLRFWDLRFNCGISCHPNPRILLSMCPSPDRLQIHTKGAKIWYPVVTCSPLCHCGSRDADVWSPRQKPECGILCGKGTKELSKGIFKDSLLFQLSYTSQSDMTRMHDTSAE